MGLSRPPQRSVWVFDERRSGLGNAVFDERVRGSDVLGIFDSMGDVWSSDLQKAAFESSVMLVR